MNLFLASEIVQATGQELVAARLALMARVRAGFLNAYVVVPLGKTITSPGSVVAFEVIDPEVTG